MDYHEPGEPLAGNVLELLKNSERGFQGLLLWLQLHLHSIANSRLLIPVAVTAIDLTAFHLKDNDAVLGMAQEKVSLDIRGSAFSARGIPGYVVDDGPIRRKLLSDLLEDVPFGVAPLSRIAKLWR
jgi:hypothetical protein